MKKSFARILAGLVIVGAVLLLNPTSKSRPAAVLAETEGCRLTSLSGTYGFAFSGYFNTGSSASPAYTLILNSSSDGSKVIRLAILPGRTSQYCQAGSRMTFLTRFGMRRYFDGCRPLLKPVSCASPS